MKSDISDRVSQMDYEEFIAFVHTLQEVNDGTDPKKKLARILQESEENSAQLRALESDKAL